MLCILEDVPDFWGGVPGFLGSVPGFLGEFRVFWGVFRDFWLFRDVPVFWCSGVPGSTTCRQNLLLFFFFRVYY